MSTPQGNWNFGWPVAVAIIAIVGGILALAAMNKLPSKILNVVEWATPSSAPNPNQPSTSASAPPKVSPTPIVETPSSTNPSPTAVPSDGRAYRIKSNDGFASVRKQPTTNSSEIDRQESGTVVYCGDIVQGQELWSGNQWRYCRKLGGFIYSPLLTPTER